MKTTRPIWKGRSKEENEFLDQYSVTARAAFMPKVDRKAAYYLIQAATPLYPNERPTHILTQLRYRWRRYKRKLQEKKGDWYGNF